MLGGVIGASFDIASTKAIAKIAKITFTSIPLNGDEDDADVVIVC
ncbi:hypothetical protein [Staphylococcus carnosus]|nr:hypothetical protein [Staphylococcus carnosus]